MSARARAVVQLGEQDRETGLIRVRFVWTGEQQPALWCPALGGPGVRPMRPAEEFQRADAVVESPVRPARQAREPACAAGRLEGESAQRWLLEAQLPASASVSWAIVPDITPLRGLIPGAVLETGPTSRPEPPDPDLLLRAAAALDAALIAEEAVAPSLFRLLGADPGYPVTPNIAVLELPGARKRDWKRMTAPAPRMRKKRLPDGRLLAIAQAESDAPRVVLLDGEVLQRCAEEVTASGVAAHYLSNRGPAQRLQDYRNPEGFAEGIAPELGSIGPIRSFVGVSAAAPSVLALACRLSAPDALLLSPVFGSPQELRGLASRAAASGVTVDIRAGGQELLGPESAGVHAERLYGEILDAGGRASLCFFPGGHDLAAWRGELLDGLEGVVSRAVESDP